MKKQTKSKTLQVRMPLAEYLTLEQRARDMGMKNVSEFIRWLIVSTSTAAVEEAAMIDYERA